MPNKVRKHYSFYTDRVLEQKFNEALAVTGKTTSNELRRLMEAYADAVLYTNGKANYERAVNRLLAKSDLAKLQPKGAN